MAGRFYVRDLQVLQDLDTELTQFNSGANTVLTNAAHDIQSCQQHIQARMGYWQAEHRRRQAVFLSAQRQNKGECRAEALAVQQAQEAISKLQRLSSRLEQTIGEYQPQANRLQQFLGSKIAKAKGDLRRSIEKYQSYINSGNSQSSLSTYSSVTDNQISATGNSGTTLQPGPYAGKSILARGPAQQFTSAERNKIDSIGRKTGCHTCGTKEPGTKNDHFIPDHQPPSGLNTSNETQKLYPHCLSCSRKQGGEVRQYMQ